MTEEEAKTKWCPFVRHRDDDCEDSCNRYGDQGVKAWNACLGSQCMAWRWEDFTEVIYGKEHHHGFCGLAGKP